MIGLKYDIRNSARVETTYSVDETKLSNSVTHKV